MGNIYYIETIYMYIVPEHNGSLYSIVAYTLAKLTE